MEVVMEAFLGHPFNHFHYHQAQLFDLAKKCIFICTFIIRIFIATPYYRSICWSTFPFSTRFASDFVASSSCEGNNKKRGKRSSFEKLFLKNLRTLIPALLNHRSVSGTEGKGKEAKAYNASWLKSLFGLYCKHPPSK